MLGLGWGLRPSPQGLLWPSPREASFGGALPVMLVEQMGLQVPGARWVQRQMGSFVPEGPVLWEEENMCVMPTRTGGRKQKNRWHLLWHPWFLPSWPPCWVPLFWGCQSWVRHFHHKFSRRPPGELGKEWAGETGVWGREQECTKERGQKPSADCFERHWDGLPAETLRLR